MHKQIQVLIMRVSSLTIITTFLSLVSVASITPITGSTSVCHGGHRTLYNATTGGTWSSGDVSVASIDPTGIVFGIAPGTATISYIVGAEFAVAIVTVNALPAIFNVTGGGSRCAGGSGVSVGIDSSETGVLYYLYLLSSGGGSSLVGSPYAGSGSGLSLGYPTAAGTYIVLATNTTTHCISEMTGSASITVNPSPSIITGPSMVCLGADLTLEDSTSGGIWISHTPAIATVDSVHGTLTGISGGTDVVSYKLPTGCYKTKIVTVDPMPLPAITYDAGANTLYATPGYDTYQWYDSIQGLIPGATTASIAALYKEYYYVKVTNDNGCERSSPLYFNWELGDVNTTTLNTDMRIAPNPAQNEIRVNCATKIKQLTIYNMMGQTVFGKKYETNDARINIANLPAGFYFLKINETAVKKFSKE